MTDIKKLQSEYWTAREEYIRAEQEFVNYGGLWAKSESDIAFYAMEKAKEALDKAMERKV